MQIEVGQVWINKKTGKRKEILHLQHGVIGPIDVEYKSLDTGRRKWILPRYFLKNYTLEVQK